MLAAAKMVRTRLCRGLRRNRRTLLILTCLIGLFYYLNLRYNSTFDHTGLTSWISQHHAEAEHASAVKEMTRFAWQGYIALCALKQSGNELAPATNSCSTQSDELVGSNNLLTVIDALDTLHLMDLKEEFQQGRQLVMQKFYLLNTPREVNVFETTIRILGGLLGAFSVTEDPVFSRLAIQVGDDLAGAFADGSFPLRVKLINNSTIRQRLEPPPPFNGGTTNPADVGSLYLEFAYLTEITGDRKFLGWVESNQRALMNVESLDGLLPIQIIAKSPWKLEAVGHTYSVGALGDSFYEYLVKRCLFDVSYESNCISVFTRPLDGIMKHLAVQTTSNHTCIIVTDGGGKKQCAMHHLTCFAGGMFALAYLQNRSRTDWLTFAEKVTETCYLSYLHSPTGLGPEAFSFDENSRKMVATEDSNFLRPETVESLYYLYHVTGKQMYRDWGWKIAKAFNSTARTTSGFSGLRNMKDKPAYDDVQWSFFLAETLKYLYLLFSSDRLPMDQWIFNTEAHIIPTRHNPLRWRLNAMHSA